MRQWCFTLIAVAVIVVGGRIGLQMVRMLSPDALGMAVGLVLGILASVPMMVYLASPRRGQTLVVTHRHVRRLEAPVDWWVVGDPSTAAPFDGTVSVPPARQVSGVYREMA